MRVFGPTGVVLTSEQRMVAQSAADFASKVVAPGAAARDADGRFPMELIAPLAEMGLLGVKVSADDGGAGADMTSYALSIAAISYACASFGVTMAVCNLAADILAAHASPTLKAQYLEPFLAGRLGPATFCLSEPGCGSDAAALQTTAIRDGDSFVLNGSKQWITNGSHAGFHVVFARVVEAGMAAPHGSKGITCFLVPRGTAGLTVAGEEKKMGLRSSNTAQLAFSDMRVPATHVIGDVGRGYSIALAFLDGGRIGVAAQCLGIAEAAMDVGVQYAKDRTAFGKPIADLNAVQNLIADSALDADQAWLLTLRAAAMKDHHVQAGPSASSMAKLFASEACGRVVDRMLQVHGGYGYVQEYPIERLYRDARVTRIYEGTSEVQRIVIARALLH
jgi:alkylation response protein AidB-like acyl-CoA dehydrogenase